MFFYALTGLINALAATVLGFFVYFKNKKTKLVRSFALFCLSIAVWSYSYYFWQIANSADSALFWSRGLMAGAIFIPILYFHFILKLLNKFKEKKKSLIIGYIVFFFFFLVNFSQLFVEGVRPKLGFAFWPDPGILYHPFLLIWFFYVFYGLYLLFKEYFVTTGLKHTQIRYILIGTIIGYTGGATNYLLWYDIPVAPVGNWTASIYLAIVAYAIVKYRLIDIRIVMRKGAIYLLSFVTIIVFGFLLIYLNNQLSIPVSFNIIGPLILVLCVLFFQFLFRFFEKISSKYFYYTFYSYQTVLTDLGRRLTQVLDLTKLSALIASTLIRTMKLDRIIILLRDPETGDYKIQKNIDFKEEKAISLVKDNFLTQYLAKTKKPLVYEELPLIQRDAPDEEKKDLEKLKENMKIMEANVCLPLIQKEKIIGIIVLGRKISGDAYYQQDLELLTTLSTQASIALENARLYSEAKKRRDELERFHKLTVGRELKMLELKREINKLKKEREDLERKFKGEI